MTKKALDQLEERIRRYWEMEFPNTRFPTTLFDTYRMLAHGYADGMSPSALAHLLHSFVIHLRTLRKRRST
jgi:hypothetical protein